MAAVAVADAEAKKALAYAKRLAAENRKHEAEQRTDLWYQTTKIVVPVWFGNCGVEEGFELGETFTAPGLLALVCVGQAKTGSDASVGHGACEVSMQMKLRPSGFDRQEARDLASEGFAQLQVHKLVKVAKKATLQFEYPYFNLTKKGQQWFDLLERSAGCTKAEKPAAKPKKAAPPEALAELGSQVGPGRAVPLTR